ncbi:MAG TPA: polysaccharide deacetylase family protein [Alphaproteobacteria bacterium]|nr:polysaccharide deacetylase family protein [Alphaproteobacteria bacterium]
MSDLGADPGGDPTYALLEHLKDVPRTRREEALAALREWSGRSDEAAGRLLLDWEELDRMAAAGVDVEAHGVTHDMLTGLPDEAVRRELAESQESLRARGHGRHRLFAYPAGRHDARVARLTAEAGFDAAFTIERRLMGPADDPFALPRLMLHQGMSASEDEFLMRVPGWA